MSDLEHIAIERLKAAHEMSLMHYQKPLAVCISGGKDSSVITELAIRAGIPVEFMLICTMCGHFDHKTDGNIVYGNQDCGEIVGYPYCKKFTPWIPTSVRLPEIGGNYLVAVKYKYDFEKEYSYDTDFAEFTFSDGYIDNCWNTYNDWNEGQQYLHITHWMPIPEPPKGE